MLQLLYIDSVKVSTETSHLKIRQVIIFNSKLNWADYVDTFTLPLGKTNKIIK